MNKKTVIMSFLAFGLFAFDARAADAIKYLDWDSAQKKMVEKTCTDYTVVTADTATFANGKWYVVNSSVSRGMIAVSGAAHLILCDGASLTLQGEEKQPGLRVTSKNSITIYGQHEGSGRLQATGGNLGAGIGGGYNGSYYGLDGALVEINGGKVTATGGYFGAGIGGGELGDGCAVQINGGVVTATGSYRAAGIGGGAAGDGGTVQISGGIVTATGGDTAAGIGGGNLGDGGTVQICGGCVKATGKGGADDIGGGRPSGGEQKVSGTVSITGGCFGMVVPESWLASGQGLAVIANQDVATCEAFPWMVTPVCRVTVGDLVNMTAAWACEGADVANAVTATAFNVPRDATVTIHFSPHPYYRFGDERFAVLTVTADRDLDLSDQVPKAEPSSSVEYLDENGEHRTVDVSLCTLVTAETTTLGDGWYVVAEPNVSRETMTVEGHAHLILGDGASLTVNAGSVWQAGLVVPSGKSLSIYGQHFGSGVFKATGGLYGAGIGGDSNVAGGKVTINGGAVTATGGEYAAGIGSGPGSPCDTVTINGGRVTATGGAYGAGVGGGSGAGGGTVQINGGIVTATGGNLGSGIGGGSGGAGGLITIRDGTVTATGGEKSAGLGGGGSGGTSAGAGGTVEIYGGRVSSTGQDGADAIGSGVNKNGQKRVAGQTSISGGVFAMELKPGWLADRWLAYTNDNPATCHEYPWTVVPACRVTVGELKDLSVAWTFGDGAVTNAASGPSFLVYSNMSATVVFTPANGYWLDGERVWDLGVVTEDWNLIGRVVARPNNLAYVKEDGKGGTVSGYTVVHDTTSSLGTGWHAVLDADVTCESMTVTGAAKLLLCNGARLSVLEGMTVASGASLTVYGQSGNAGFLDAVGGTGKPGIGGAGAVTIVGGTVTAQGGDGDGVPGIGAKSVVIRGGSVGASVLNARDASGTALWRVAVEGLGTAAPTFADLPSGYGTAGISPVDGAVYLWMPNGSYGFKVNGDIYAATVKNANVVATRAQWTIGAGVTAAWVDGVLTIAGKGKIDDFASADDVPWQGLPVANVTIPAGVTPGRNLLAGLADTTTVNGAAVSLIRQLSGDFLIGGLAPAEAKALEIDGGQVCLTVEVDASTDLKAWKPAKTVEIAVPVEGEKGFYVLKSK